MILNVKVVPNDIFKFSGERVNLLSLHATFKATKITVTFTFYLESIGIISAQYCVSLFLTNYYALFQ